MSILKISKSERSLIKEKNRIKDSLLYWEPYEIESLIKRQYRKLMDTGCPITAKKISLIEEVYAELPKNSR